MLFSTSTLTAATISGEVKSVDGQPLSFAQVYLYSFDSYYYDSFYISEEDNGQYIFENVPIGEYYLEFTSYGFVNEYYDNAIVRDDASVISILSEDETKLNIDITLDKFSSISGQVTDAEGVPVSFINFELFREYEGSWYYSGSDTTYNDGRFEITYLNSGNYRLRINDTFNEFTTFKGIEYFNNSHNFENSENINLSLNEKRIIDIVLGDLDVGLIKGKVVDFENNPVENAFIHLYMKENNSWLDMGKVLTDASGTYQFDNLLSNEYKVQMDANISNEYAYVSEYYDNAIDLESADTINLGIGEELENINFELQRLPRITGVVKDIDGNALPYVKVEPFVLSEFDNKWLHAFNEVYTDFSGRFNMLIPVGQTYRLRFSEDEYYYYSNPSSGVIYEYFDNVANIEDASDITLSLNEEISIDVVLGDYKTGAISGFVLDSSGQPIQNVLVFATVTGSISSLNIYSNSNEDGYYEINNLYADNYTILTSTYDYINEYFNDATNIEDSTIVTVDSGESVQNINFDLNKFATISGVITHKDGIDLSNAQILLYKKNMESGEFEFFENAYAYYQGEYSFSQLKEGMYRLRYVLKDEYEYFENLANASGSEFLLALNTDLIANASLGDYQFGTINGQVRDDLGNLIYGAFLRFERNNDGTWENLYGDYGEEIGVTETYRNGSYSIRLEQGDYRVTIFRDYFDYDNDIVENGIQETFSVNSNQDISDLNFRFSSLNPNLKIESIPTLQLKSLFLLMFLLYLISLVQKYVKYRK